MSPSNAQIATVVQPRAVPRSLARFAILLTGSVLLALSAQVALPVPFSPVPITLQTLTVLALGALLGRQAAASVLLYLAGAGLGLPILASGYGGLNRLAGPTGGYLAGFVAAAYVVGALSHPASMGRAAWLRRLGLFLLGEVVLYACGLLWLARFVPAERLLMAGLYPFLIGDAYKLAGAVLLTAPSAPVRRWLALLHKE